MNVNLTRLTDLINVLSLFRLCIVTFLLGGVGAMALPPFYIIPSLLSFSALMLILDAATNKDRPIWSCFWVSWWFGFGYFTFGLYWIANALTVDIAKFWWVFPFSIFGLPFILAFFTAIPGMACGVLRWRGLSLYLGFSCFWVFSEWLRSFLFTGFPWNLLGYIWAFSDEMMQLASITGVYGLSLISLLLATASLTLFSSRYKFFSYAVLLLVVVSFMFGFHRLSVPTQFHDGVWMRIVQPNIPQKAKWDPAERENNFDLLLKLSHLPSKHKLSAIIWPETAIPFFLEQEVYRRQVIQTVVPDSGYVLTGAPRRSPYGVKPVQIWNSILAVDEQGEVVTSYDKSHLVPFGEYFPFRKWIEPYIEVTKVTAGSVDFSSGEGPTLLKLSHLPSFGGLICYESIFPSEVIKPGERPEWLLNVTNDGWYGNSPGPSQHLAISRMRSVEEGVPMVRSANTGISAVFDDRGRMIQRLGLMSVGVIDFQLPKALPMATFYGKYGNLVILCILAILFGTLIIINQRVAHERLYLHQ